MSAYGSKHHFVPFPYINGGVFSLSTFFFYKWWYWFHFYFVFYKRWRLSYLRSDNLQFRHNLQFLCYIVKYVWVTFSNVLIFDELTKCRLYISGCAFNTCEIRFNTSLISCRWCSARLGQVGDAAPTFPVCSVVLYLPHNNTVFPPPATQRHPGRSTHSQEEKGSKEEVIKRRKTRK